MITESDNHLMEEVWDGRVEKLAILFERHHVMLYNFFLRLNGNRSASESLNAIWVKLGVLPEEQPGFELRTRFYSMLEAHKEGMIPEESRRSFLKNFSDRVGRFMPRKPLHQFAFSLALLIAGIALGYFFLTSKQIENAKVTALRQEVQNMQEMMAVFLLDQPWPSKRLKGVSWSSRLEQPEEKTLQALLRTNPCPTAR